ncbi:hypothetical protein [Marichromatium bheemlicum]|uniref:Uncharacterized protein n=1 Tax=Marichromatium bheemlicum TaxID=365339 RepID=A0ABX1I6R9_9GAMM|nr:hypothetical protein [Marichromatium bheemlicum]NKN32441.1 hypothetical protein [Marichromatium bheemlicum]
MSAAMHASFIRRALGGVLLGLMVTAPALGEETSPATTPMPMSGQGQMMPGGMPPGMGPGGPAGMPPMMRSRMAMQQAHMERMERHMANIERLLEELVELQRQGD